MACRSHTETGHSISETHQILTFAGMPELLTLGHDVIYKGHAQNHTVKNFHLFGFVSATLSQPIWPAATNWTHLPEHNKLVTKCLPGSFLNQNSDTYIKVTWK